MINRTLKVIINNMVVHEEMVREDISMMRGHQLKKIFCIDTMISNGIDAKVHQCTDKGETELKNVQLEGTELIVQSKMNDENFTDSMDWFDEKLFVGKDKR